MFYTVQCIVNCLVRRNSSRDSRLCVHENEHNRVAYDNDLYVIKKLVYCAHSQSVLCTSCSTHTHSHSASPAAKPRLRANGSHSSSNSSSSVHSKLFILVCKAIQREHPLSSQQRRARGGGYKNVFGVFHPESIMYFSRVLIFQPNEANARARVGYAFLHSEFRRVCTTTWACYTRGSSSG